MSAGRPREFDYDEALDKAMHVFWKKGYEGASMPDLTDAMGMNRPSVYAAFGNKEELFRKALELYSEKSMAKFRDILSAPKLKDAITKFMCSAAESFACPNSPKGCMSVQGALACSDDAKSSVQQAAQRREDIFVVLSERFEKGLHEGELEKGTDTKALARFFTTVLNGLSIQSASGISCQDLKLVAENALKILPA